ncbi:beta-fimbriae major subunit [Yersinia frederiksenii]|uniref:Beta-fimbriae major subunit n=2 Tax=Yersinia frederiksenii TaxID=29484 RepID=A0A380Q232_YERFR|nr:DUF1120 domain-containing protein [Yersinia frederiksenii]ATM96378.1 DUF1120 domain-containing protein [Yersinia frederiksenii]EEQ15152.1 hypothetical protein yfred0001_7030 [Yersinia frederiksenii ATCC 33641]KGA48010.1 hypothetical protein DJ58_3658 [Yersinia frederiksenii ATCC 33641]MDN0120336.1 DUF1120 domain-containing protein [Yersinia frederiksenii]CFQ87530.1 beta-fimbriae major subunit [Yersinia frederiksenii]
MKKQLAKMTVLSSLIFGINAANAEAPTAELKVVGTLTVPSCTIVAPDEGVYDFGHLSSSLVKSGVATTALTPITKTWTVNCDAETYLNFTPVDNRTASASVVATTNFGMGNVNGSGKLGYYTAQMKNGTVDGKTSNVFSSATTTFAAASAANLTTGLRTGWSSAANTQSTGKVFTADITVSPTLAGTTTMGGPITEDAEIDGSMTMNFAFGI